MLEPSQVKQFTEGEVRASPWDESYINIRRDGEKDNRQVLVTFWVSSSELKVAVIDGKGRYPFGFR